MSTAASQPHGSRGGGCCSSGGTLELVAAFTAVCLALYGVILYLNYLYVRWSGGRDRVHRTTGSGAAAGKRGGGGGLDKAALAAMAPVFRFKPEEAAAGQWNVGRSEMDTNGKCRRCGEKLVCIDIDPSETETFAKSLTELACKREVREDFLRFQEWLHRHGPFDAVIDAANVGLYNSKAFSFSQVNSVVNGIQRITKSKKLPLIVLHRSRVNGGPAKLPHNQKLLEVWQNAGALYATPPGSNDDWYWLYAAVSCRSLLVTNDEMRDHLFQLLGTSFFPRWKEKHQVRLTYSGRGPAFHLPPPYSIVTQESEAGSWHIPTTTGDDIENPRQWVCATRKSSEKSSALPQTRLSEMGW